jgi:hypothetical protein
MCGPPVERSGEAVNVQVLRAPQPFGAQHIYGSDVNLFKLVRWQGEKFGEGARLLESLCFVFRLRGWFLGRLFVDGAHARAHKRETRDKEACVRRFHIAARLVPSAKVPQTEKP